jgi:hypothetical protein
MLCVVYYYFTFEHSGVLMYKCIVRFACLNAISKLSPSIEQTYVVSMIIEGQICRTILYYNFHTQPLQDASCIYKNM